MPPTDQYTSATTAKSLVLSVESFANNPDLHLTSAGADPANAAEIELCLPYRWLNEILRELTTLHDWPHARVARTITIAQGARSFAPPNDFFRMAEDSSFWLQLDNSRPQLSQVTREVFFANETDDDLPAQPRNFYVDRKATTSIFLDPMPDKQYLGELHYFATTARITDVNATLAFPHTSYLEAALLVKYYLHQDDTRVQSAEAIREKLWKQIRNTNFDIRETSGFAALDGDVFKSQPVDYE